VVCPYDFPNLERKVIANLLNCKHYFLANPLMPIMGLHEELFKLRKELIGLKHIITGLVNQNTELKMERMNEKNTGYSTIEEVERYFDLSAPLQQQERC
jgi:hypothetical protein